MTEPAPAPEVKKLPMKARLKKAFEEYGTVAIYTYFGLSILTIIGFSLAIGLGIKADDANGVIGTNGAGWVAAKATNFIRIPIVLAITPVIHRMVQRRKARRRARRLDVDDVDADDDDDDDAE